METSTTPKPTAPTPRRRSRCSAVSPTGTDLTSGQPMRRPIRSGRDMGDGRTTRALSKLVVGRAELARQWQAKGDSAPTLTEFLEAASDMSVRSVMASNPGFTLPDWCAFPADNGR